MRLPESLRQAIEQEMQGRKLSSLSAAAAQLSASYRQSRVSAMPREIDKLAYVVSRLPATYAATRAVLADICERMADLRVESVLDLGAGTGSASWAAADAFPDAQKIALIEKDRSLVHLGQSFARRSECAALHSAAWQVADLTALPSFAPHDLVLLSYVVGELDAPAQLSLVQRAWTSARSVLAIVEPGTPAAFSRIRVLRDALLRNGARMVSPCPHERECPMPGTASPDAAGKADWCHFAQRVERTSLHRRVKGGALGYEDEKYSYVAVARAPAQLPSARIVRRPMHRAGFVEFSLCASDGLRKENVSRRQTAAFRRARHSAWGDAWESSAE